MVTSERGRSGTDRIRWGDRSDAGNGSESQHVDGVRPLLSTCSRSSEAVPGGIERALGTASRRPSGALAVTAASADPEDRAEVIEKPASLGTKLDVDWPWRAMSKAQTSIAAVTTIITIAAMTRGVPTCAVTSGFSSARMSPRPTMAIAATSARLGSCRPCSVPIST